MTIDVGRRRHIIWITSNIGFWVIGILIYTYPVHGHDVGEVLGNGLPFDSTKRP